jgi:hypothetical protein
MKIFLCVANNELQHEILSQNRFKGPLPPEGQGALQQFGAERSLPAQQGFKRAMLLTAVAAPCNVGSQ